MPGTIREFAIKYDIDSIREGLLYQQASMFKQSSGVIASIDLVMCTFVIRLLVCSVYRLLLD